MASGVEIKDAGASDTSLDGTELVPVQEAAGGPGSTKHTTTQAIADLGGGGGGVVDSVNGDAGPDVVLDASDVGADPVGAATTAVSDHEAASDPHPQYLTATEGNAAYDALGAASTVNTALGNHISDASAAHAASAVSADSATLVGTGTDVQAVLEELDNAIVADETALANHLADTSDAHDASAVSTSPTFGTGTDVEAILDTLTREINVMAYGARNDYDGTVDELTGNNPTILAANDAAFALAWADAKAANGTLVIPPGEYGLSPDILATTSADAGIRGEDEATVRIWSIDSAGTGTCVSQSITDTTYWSATSRRPLPSITGFTISGRWAGAGSVGLRVGPAHTGYYSVQVVDFNGTGGANGVSGLTGAIGILMQNNPAAPTQFTESCTFGPRTSWERCTNGLVVDPGNAAGVNGHRSFGYNQFQFARFRNCTGTGIRVTNGAWLYAGSYNLEGVTTTSITMNGIIVDGSDPVTGLGSRFTGSLDWRYEINAVGATVVIITTASGTIWKTDGYIDALTAASAQPTNSIAGVFEHEGPCYISPLPAGNDGWMAQGPFDGPSTFPVDRTAGASGVASVFTVYGDFRERYKVGTRVRWTESGSVKYGVVSIDSTFGSSVTTITLYADTTYFMSVDPDKGSLRYSFASPPDLPANFRLLALGISALVAAALDETTIAAFLTALTLDPDLATLSVPASTTIGSAAATFLGTPSSANLAAAVTDETGSGALVFANTPTLVTPVLGDATATTLAMSSQLNEAKAADIASASTTDIGAMAGNMVVVTGTATITALGTAPAGAVRIVQFSGAATLTHNGTSLNLPGSVNITTANGDCAIFVSYGSGNWRCVSYMKKGVTGTGQTVLATSPTLQFGSPFSAYQEGTWTPTLEGSTTAGTGWTYSVNTGYYTLIGRVVFFSLRITMTAKSGDAAGNARIMGLPYTVKNANANQNSLNVNFDNLTTAIVSSAGRAEINTTYLQFYIRTAAAVSGTVMAVGDLANTTVIVAAGQYVIA